MQERMLQLGELCVLKDEKVRMMADSIRTCCINAVTI